MYSITLDNLTNFSSVITVTDLINNTKETTSLKKSLNYTIFLSNFL